MLDLERRLKQLACKYGRWDRLCEVDDMLQIARIAAWKSEQSYKEGMGKSRENWAYMKAQGAILLMRKRAHCSQRWDQKMVHYDALLPHEREVYMATPDFSYEVIERIAQTQKPDVSDLPQPSPAELSVLKTACAGKTAQEVAEELCLSKRTVETHLNQIYKKWNVKGIVSAYNIAMKTGLVDPPQRSMA